MSSLCAVMLPMARRDAEFAATLTSTGTLATMLPRRLLVLIASAGRTTNAPRYACRRLKSMSSLCAVMPPTARRDAEFAATLVCIIDVASRRRASSRRLLARDRKRSSNKRRTHCAASSTTKSMSPLCAVMPPTAKQDAESYPRKYGHEEAHAKLFSSHAIAILGERPTRSYDSPSTTSPMSSHGEAGFVHT